MYEYRSLIKHITNADSNTGKSNNNGELYLAGIITNISKKKDSRGNQIAFVEFEDLAGKFEVSLFNKDYLQYSKIISPGKVFFITGTKSTFNGNDDAMLRILPNSLIPFDALANELRGEIKVHINDKQVKKGCLTDLGERISRCDGKFKLITTIQKEDVNSYQLESRKLFFPGEGLLNWLKKEKIDFQIRLVTNGKST